MTDLLKELLETSDYVMNRLDERLAGMTDEEHQWKPVAGAWTVLADGTVEHVDAAGRPDEPPLTTIAWRLWHIGFQNIRGFAERAWDVAPVEMPVNRWHPDAAASRAEVRDSYQRLRAGIVAKGNVFLEQQMGPSWGPYADATFAGLLLHVIDENIHHGAEVGMLRDLYRLRSR